MLYMLIVVILQNGSSETFYDKFESLKDCKIAQSEARKHNNSVTKVTAICIKRDK